MRYAVIDGSHVINVIEADEGFVLDGYELVQSDEAGPGWCYADGVFSPPSPPPASGDQINVERDRRISAGTTVNVTGYGDIPLQGGERDQTNLLGLVTAAQVRLAGGDTATLTKFRDAENVDHMLTPMQVIEMWSKGAAWISANYDASWALKAMDPIPADFADDSYWP